MSRNIRAEQAKLQELRRIERICLEHAEFASMDLERAGFLYVAGDCRTAIRAIEAWLHQRQ
jgi:hypothetical protein